MLGGSVARVPVAKRPASPVSASTTAGATSPSSSSPPSATQPRRFSLGSFIAGMLVARMRARFVAGCACGLLLGILLQQNYDKLPDLRYVRSARPVRSRCAAW